MKKNTSKVGGSSKEISENIHITDLSDRYVIEVRKEPIRESSSKKSDLLCATGGRPVMLTNKIGINLCIFRMKEAVQPKRPAFGNDGDE